MQGRSQLSGAFVVEDVPAADDGSDDEQPLPDALKGAGKLFMRRLVFLSNHNAVQSEARVLLPLSASKKLQSAASTTVDHSYLAFPYHAAMVASLALLADAVDVAVASRERLRVLVLGLGGGALPMHMATQCPWAAVTAVDLDPAVVAAATRYFGFAADRIAAMPGTEGAPAECVPVNEEWLQQLPAPGKCNVILGDAIAAVAMIQRCGNAACRPHVVIVDVDAKDTSTGLSFPPQAFVSRAFLRTLHAAIHPAGLLLMNVACRAKPLQAAVMMALTNEFAPAAAASSTAATAPPSAGAPVADSQGAAGVGVGAGGVSSGLFVIDMQTSGDLNQVVACTLDGRSTAIASAQAGTARRNAAPGATPAAGKNASATPQIPQLVADAAQRFAANMSTQVPMARRATEVRTWLSQLTDGIPSVMRR